jgi:hypothetical protein
MARGWGKPVEDQMTERESEPMPVAAAKREAMLAEASRKREQQSLLQQRERVLSERTSSPHRRAALMAALEQIEAQLKTLAEQ